MNAYDIMHEWDNATGKGGRSDAELDTEVPPILAMDYAAWKAAIEARDVKAIRMGMQAWGLPIAPLKPFEVDDAIETYERGMDITKPE
jgi:hypothetical protein